MGGSRDTIKRSRDFQNISESLNMKKLFTKFSYSEFQLFTKCSYSEFQSIAKV